MDKSPSVRLARFPRLRRALQALRVLSRDQASGFPTGVVHADVSRSLPYGDGSASHVYSSHLIEHLSRWQALDFLAECRRVLAPGGVIRTATPDLRAMASTYLSAPQDGGRPPADVFMEQLATYQDVPANRVQRFIKRNLSASHHQWLYDVDSLSGLLLDAGFQKPIVRAFREGETPDLELLEHRPGSLVIEARR